MMLQVDILGTDSIQSSSQHLEVNASITSIDLAGNVKQNIAD